MDYSIYSRAYIEGSDPFCQAALPASHSLVTQPGSIFALTSLARSPFVILAIGRLSRSQMAIAGNQSKGDTSIDRRSICAAKSFAFVMRHDSPDALHGRSKCAAPAKRHSRGHAAHERAPCRFSMSRTITVLMPVHPYLTHFTNTSSPPDAISECRRNSGSWGCPLSVTDLIASPHPVVRMTNVFPPGSKMSMRGYALPCMM